MRSCRVWPLALVGVGALAIGCHDNATPPTPPPGAPATTKLFAGARDTCALRPDGSLWCWGTAIATPVQLPGTWKSVANAFLIMEGGSTRASAIRDDGTWWQWDDETGALEQQGTDTDWAAIALGGSWAAGVGWYVCLTKTDGSLWCQGDNDSGQLGPAPAGCHSQAPSEIMCDDLAAVGGNDWVKVFANAPEWEYQLFIQSGVYRPLVAQTCATKTDETLWCWGDGNSQPALVPGAATITLGDQYSCTIDGQGAMSCSGSLALASDQVHIPDIAAPIGALDGTWTTVSADKFHACGIQSDGSLWCWGRNDYGQLGDGAGVPHTTQPPGSSQPTFEMFQVPGSWTDVTVGDFYTCAVSADESVWCWGDDRSNDLGVARGCGIRTPSPVLGNGYSRASAGGATACATKPDGTLVCWGYQYATSSYFMPDDTVETPVAIAGNQWTQIAAAGGYACATRGDHTLWCWGDNGYGELGDGTTIDRTQPVQVPGTDWSRVAVSGITCAVKMDSSLWCWGDIGPQHSPVPVQAFGSGWVDVQTSTSICALDNTGAISCWLGYGADPTAMPTPVPGTGWASVSVGTTWNGADTYACAIKSDASLWCWGKNGKGELGDGTVIDRAMPTQVAGQWSEVSASDHTCAVKTDGTLWCWGSNDFAQLGTGTGDLDAHPVPAQLPGSGWAHVSASDGMTCATKSDGTVWCWPNACLGDGSAWLTSPVRLAL